MGTNGKDHRYQHKQSLMMESAIPLLRTYIALHTLLLTSPRPNGRGRVAKPVVDTVVAA